MGGEKFKQKENEKKEVEKDATTKKYYHTKNSLHKFCLNCFYYF
jgi:hypothetical protein